MNTYDFVGGPYDGRKETRPDSKPIVVHGHIPSYGSYIAGEYRAGTKGRRGKMVWHQNKNRAKAD